MSDDRATASGNRRSEIDEQLLLKEWDFTRFFQGFNEKLDKMKQEHQQEAAGQASKSTGSNEDRSSSSSERTLKRQEQLARRKHEQHHQKQHQLKPVHRRQESDSKLGNASNAFTRAFRRENSDFFPSARHSAYLKSSDSAQRSSIFASGNRRGSEMSVAGIIGKKGGGGGGGLNSGEPILTDFSLNRDGPQRPRREKTESEIVFGNRHEARRLDFGRDKDENARRRSCRPSDATASAVVDDAGTIKSTASTTASEYSPIVTQVSPLSESSASPPPHPPTPRISRDNFASPSCLCACLTNPFLSPCRDFFCLLSSLVRPRNVSSKCLSSLSRLYGLFVRRYQQDYT